MMILNTLEIASEPILNPRRPKVWVTARNSFIARNILDQLDYDFTATRHSDLDLTNPEEVSAFLEDSYFDYVIHTACVGGRQSEDTQEIFDANFDMFENLKNNQDHYKYLINFGSGAEFSNSWYGKAKRIISMIVKEHPNMVN